jgi:hypothetical protein
MADQPMTVEPIFSCSVLPNQSEGAYGSVLKLIKTTLQNKGVEDARRHSINDIVLECLVNIDLHHRVMCETVPEVQIELRAENGDIVIEMRGPAYESDLKRMGELVNLYRDKDEDWLWSERRRISRSGRPFETDGAGLGILTIAALSRSGTITCSSEYRGETAYFMLTSRV